MLKDVVKNLEPSSTLRINEISKKLESEGKKIYKFGRPNKEIIYPLAILLLIIFGYLNYRRKE